MTTNKTQAILDSEVLCLFDDLSEAHKRALDGAWSMQCDWLVDRIAALHSIGASLTPLRETTMTGSFYREVLKRIEEWEGVQE